MIYEMSQDVQDYLHAKKYPVVVLYGTQPVVLEYGSGVIIIERDTSQSDGIDPAVGVQRNARKIRTRHLACEARVYAASTLEGAALQDHERLCEALVDALVVALERWGVEGGAGPLPYTEARYLTPAELGDDRGHEREQWPGVVYRLRFRVPRALLDLTFEGEARPTASATITSTTVARAPGFDPATGCGG